MGGRGAESTTRYKGGGSGTPVSTSSLISEREGKQKLVDDTLTVFRDVENKYGFIANDIQIAEMDKKGASTIAYYDMAGNIAVNKTFFNERIDKAYKECVESGFHPSNGNKSAIQAVASHELGHAINDMIAKKTGNNDIDSTATKIVNEARKNTNHRGVVQMASKISKYATASNAEAIAEAFADVYCNGNKAKAESKAIMQVVDSYF